MSEFEGVNAREVYGIRKYCVEYERDTAIVSRGYLIINYRDAIKDKPVGLIEDIWTEEKHRRQGLASIIMNGLIDIAKREGCYKVTLSCDEKNVSLYEKFGFVKHQNAMRLSLK